MTFVTPNNEQKRARFAEARNVYTCYQRGEVPGRTSLAW